MKIAKLTPIQEPKQMCNKNWHVFSPAGNTICNCGKSTENPLNKLAEEAKKYNL